MNLGLFCYWLFWTLVAGALGFLAAWFMRASKLDWWKSQFESKDAAYNKLEGDHNNFMGRYKKIEKEKNSLFATNKTLTTDMSTFKTKATDYESKWNIARGERDDWKSKVETWESRYKSIANELPGKNEEIERLKGMIGDWDSERNGLMAKVKDAEAQADAASKKTVNDIKEYKDRFEDANLERNTLKVKYETLLAERTKETEDVAALRKSNTDMTAELEALKAANAAHDAKSAEWNNQIAALTTKNEASTREYEEVKIKYESLLRHQEQHEAKSKEMMAEHAKMTEEIAQLKNKAGETDTLNAKMNELNNEITQLKGKASELEAANAKVNALTNEMTQLKGQQAGDAEAAKAKLNNMTEELNQLRNKANQLEAANAKINSLTTEMAQLKGQAGDANTLRTQLNEANNKVNQLNAQVGDLNNKMSGFNMQINDLNGFKAKWEILNNEKPQWENRAKTLQEEIDRLKAQMQQAKSQQSNNAQLEAKLNELSGYKQKWTVLNAERPEWISKHNNLDSENTRLRKELEKMRAEMAAKPVAVAAPAKPATKEEKAAKANEAKSKFTAALGTKVKKATAADKDDLKLISGVGPFIEKKLNAIGIYTFEQVSQFDNDLVQVVNDAIEFFPGRILRDDWVGQAAKLHQDKVKNN